MRRISWIDFGKGFTIFFVLVAHCIDELYGTKLFTDFNLFSQISLEVIYTFIMPCFFALSGFLYKTPKNLNDYAKSIYKKSIGLLIPYTIFSIIYVVLQHCTKVNKLNSWDSLLYIYIRPISYLWFLYILFFIFLVVEFFDLIHTPQQLQIIIYVSLFFLFQILHTNIYISNTFSWIPCFYMGILIKKYSAIFKNKLLILILSIYTISCLSLQPLIKSDWFRTNGMTLNTFSFKLTSIVLIFFLFSIINQNKLFDYFKKYGKDSMIIYLVHLPITSMFKIVLIKVGISNYILLLFLLITLSWLLSIFICHLSHKLKIINFIFYPYTQINTYFRRGLH